MHEAAERIIRPGLGQLQDDAIRLKAPGEVVTIVDRACEALLSERLSAIHPEAIVVGEEAVEDDPRLLELLGTELCWIVDPLDGTANYAAGKAPYGIMVALAQAGEILGGWILDPTSGRLCGAELGHGARIDGKLFNAPGRHRETPIAAISRLFTDASRRDRVVAALAACDVTDSPRCAADQYPRVALGIHDLTYFDRTISWDHAAGVLFINECGGRAAHPDGATYRVDQPRAGLLIATDPVLWDSVAPAVAAAL
ncbi:inositol monophosphatase family protein [Novosphingobium piscinae]|uniref:Inositol monophosphatase n=1 Tax=Novosphingobium piscinae TaxID=1507448 RepID=A0A7X1FY44_9SPHN|nr:inositol monophosphatase family protein [Novosphingobium piscinae]MBC2669078.1 inositol monophosphatase [Novosphingobium piscinae]